MRVDCNRFWVTYDVKSSRVMESIFQRERKGRVRPVTWVSVHKNIFTKEDNFFGWGTQNFYYFGKHSRYIIDLLDKDLKRSMIVINNDIVVPWPQKFNFQLCMLKIGKDRDLQGGEVLKDGHENEQTEENLFRKGVSQSIHRTSDRTLKFWKITILPFSQ